MGFCAQVCSEQEVPRERKKVSGYIREGRVRRRVIFAACRAESKRRKKGRCNLGRRRRMNAWRLERSENTAACATEGDFRIFDYYHCRID